MAWAIGLAIQTRRPYNSPTRQAQADATRAAILGAARDVFARSGYAAATIEAIAAAAGVSVPTVYAVFGSKPRLLAALVADAGSAGDIRRLAAKALAQTDPERRIAAAAKVVRTIMEREGALLEMLKQAGSSHPELEEAMKQTHRQQREALGQALRPFTNSEEGLAAFCVLASPESYWQLVDELGWSPARWERWLAASGIRLLLDR